MAQINESATVRGYWQRFIGNGSKRRRRFRDGEWPYRRRWMETLQWFCGDGEWLWQRRFEDDTSTATLWLQRFDGDASTVMLRWRASNGDALMVSSRRWMGFSSRASTVTLRGRSFNGELRRWRFDGELQQRMGFSFFVWVSMVSGWMVFLFGWVDERIRLFVWDYI